MASKTITIRVPKELSDQLDRLALSMRRSKSFLVTEALASYVALNAWQVEQIEKGLAEARSGAPGVPQADVEAWVRSSRTLNERPKPVPKP